MVAFGIYSLKAGVILTVFWGIYLLFLQKETFYRFNRGFLLTGIAAAVLLPLIVIRYTVEVTAPAISAPMLQSPAFPMTELPTIPTGESNRFSFINFYSRLLPVVYLTVLSVLLLVRSIGLVRIFLSIRRNRQNQPAGYQIIESSEFDHAFTFFRSVFIPLHLTETEKEIILAHENAHVKQHHWIDLCLTNLLSLMWWFNPIVRFYEKAVRNNQEYLADREVLTGFRPADYQQALLNQWMKSPVFAITHSFSHSNNFKRINMMKKNISNPTKKFFALLAIPAIAIFLMAFSEKEYVINNADDKKEDAYSAMLTGTEGKVMLKTDKFILTADTLTFQQTDTIKFTGKEYVIDNTDDKKEDKPLIVIDGNEILNFETMSPDEIHSVSVLKNNAATDVFGRKGKNGVILITTKAFATQNHDSGQQHVILVQPKAEIVADLKENNTFSFLNNASDKPLIIVDDKEFSTIENLLPEEIESISVLKNNAATDVYGEKGKNGVILITTKKNRK